MRDINQKIIKFNFDENFDNNDFYVSKSNEHTYNLINKWPNWEKNFLNISGEKLSGKSHLTSIFLKKFKGIKFNAKSLNNENLKEIKIFKISFWKILIKILTKIILYTM